MGLFSKLREKLQKRKEVSTDEKVYKKGLDKSRTSFKDKINKILAVFRQVDEEYFASLEELLISADVGASLSMEIVDDLKQIAKEKNIEDPNKIMDLLFEKIYEDYQENVPQDTSIKFNEDSTTIILVMGVNGVGKTTSIAKLANSMKKQGKKVLLVAADTFRAGAVEQLSVWADRLNVDIVVGKLNSDPSSVIYDGVSKAIKDNYDVCIIDTAGRLTTKINLMNEADKMNRVVEKVANRKADEYLLVIDATTGQNGVYQAKAFAEVAPISGIILTKMDGTSKGGIILSIKESLSIPVKYIGLGEQLDDLQEFDLDSYLNGLLGLDEKED